MRKLTLFLVLLALFAGLWVTAGCGDSKEEGAGETVEETAAEETTSGEAVSGTGSGNAGGGGGGAQSGSASFSLEDQVIGNGTFNPDLKVTDITWADHGDYFRIVFELKKADGTDLTAVPNCHTWYSNPYYVLILSLDDIPTWKYDYPLLQEAVVPVQFGDPVVQMMFRWSTADGEPITIEVTCAYSEAHPGVSSRPHRLTYEANPMRVILDIQKT